MAGAAVDHGRYIRILQTFLCYIQSQMLCVEGFQIRQDFLPQRQGSPAQGGTGKALDHPEAQPGEGSP